ncbi:ninjurin-2 isoform X2 [Condylostylus longicornis]|uniref:ninjurin-2 isoform X2 n=1 Tax=Condylostylus longicornis TaxID=2530218 RepID=UPI00244E40CF|nr:ninjurin-2 isoform X2 [Condylostylus longicornis]
MLDCCGKKAKDVVDDGNNNNNTENGVGTGEQNNEGMKAIDANRYATKKTIAQGMLDIALLTANASQLKYILQVGERHDFYKLMLGLISTSIILQLLVGVLFVIIGSLNINRKAEQAASIILNDVILIFVFVISVVNVIISGFGIEHASHPLILVNKPDL